ncbi:MAG: SDR family oxidoreductase [SAR324 cluster bacterium]|nr:SDR family oxidoreductase [SAR324 cluster bacterium]
MQIVISGASLGIGEYLTKSLVGEGHQVWGLARSAAPLKALKKELGGPFFYSPCNVSSYEQLSKARAAIAEEWQTIDAIICCAGIQGAMGDAMKNDPAEWSHTVRVNLDGTYYTIHALYGLLGTTSSRKKVVCFSGGGATSPRTNFSAYAVSKTGVVRLVENLAVEWKGQNIDINAIAPGAINTRMTEQVIARGPEIIGEEYHKAVQQKESGGGSLEKVLQTVRYFLSSESDGISGKLISAVWDSWHEFESRQQDIQNSDIYTLRRIVPKDRGFDWE